MTNILMMAVAMWMAMELAVAITLMFAMAMVMVMVIKKGMAPTMAIFSLNAQAGGQVVELGGVPDGPAALNIEINICKNSVDINIKE